MLREGDGMKTETETKVSEVYVAGTAVTITVRHDLDYECAFRLQAGCVDEYVTENDLIALRQMLNVALRKLRAVSR